MRRLNRGRQGGVSLIETLVTLLVLSVGLIGLASLQTRTLQFNQDAQLRSLANVLLDDMAERCRDPQASAASLASETASWQQYVGQSLPDGVTPPDSEKKYPALTRTQIRLMRKYEEGRAARAQDAGREP